MGWNTYKQIITELSPDKWIYEDLTSYVLTHKKINDENKIKFVNGNLHNLISNLKVAEGKDIWICGGANIISQLLKESLIDCFYITVIPVLLGNGIRLFEAFDNEVELNLIAHHDFNGMVDLIYECR